MMKLHVKLYLCILTTRTSNSIVTFGNYILHSKFRIYLCSCQYSYFHMTLLLFILVIIKAYYPIVNAQTKGRPNGGPFSLFESFVYSLTFSLRLSLWLSFQLQTLHIRAWLYSWCEVIREIYVLRVPQGILHKSS